MPVDERLAHLRKIDNQLRGKRVDVSWVLSRGGEPTVESGVLLCVATSATNSVAPTVIIETKGYHPQAFSSACIISIVAADQEVQR
jgi:hypothetical protein